MQNSFLYGPLSWISRILGWPCFIIGIGLLVATFMGKSLFEFADYDEKISSAQEAYQYFVLIIQMVCGIALLLIGIVLLFIGNLCIQIVRRNNHITELEDLIHKKLHRRGNIEV